MSPTRGRRIALTVGIPALAVLVVAGVAAKDWLREEWYILQLSSPDQETRDRATAVLGELKSVRAVPRLIRLLEEERAKDPDGWPLVWSLQPVHDREAFYAMDPISHALCRIGPSAVPLLSERKASFEDLESILRAIAASTSDKTPVGNLGRPPDREANLRRLLAEHKWPVYRSE